jgi:hypothetical protein
MNGRDRALLRDNLLTILTNQQESRMPDKLRDNPFTWVIISNTRYNGYNGEGSENMRKAGENCITRAVLTLRHVCDVADD